MLNLLLDLIELLIFWLKVYDVDGNMIYLSLLIGVVIIDIGLFEVLEGFFGGIFVEEMGFGKMLEVISLMFLYFCLEINVMVYDYFLGRELFVLLVILIVMFIMLFD